MNIRNGVRFLASRMLTAGLYGLVILGIWDHHAISGWWMGFRLFMTVMILRWAVDRSIGHYADEHPGTKR